MRRLSFLAACAVAVLLTQALGNNGGASAQTTGSGTFASTPVYSADGLAAVVFNGGTVDQLEAASQAAGAGGAWVQDGGGNFRLLVVGAPAFLRDAFKAQFPSGFGVIAVTLKAAPPSLPLPTGPSVPLLKYTVLDRFGHVWYCDRDFYPIARDDEGALARQRFAEIQRDAVTFDAILGRLNYAPAPSYSDAQVLAIYREWKKLEALVFEPVSVGYRFAARFTRDDNAGTQVEGTITPNAQITVISQAAAGTPICPICLAVGTSIATPGGPVPVEQLREGMAVWTLDAAGRRVAGTVLVAASTEAPAGHEVVRLVLDDGRVLRASPGHPLADGRALADIVAGDVVDGARVVSAGRVAYEGARTFDLLASGATGAYWADGVPLASTIRLP